MDDLLKTLLDAGAVVVRFGDGLVVKCEGGSMPGELSAAIRERKAEILAVLERSEQLLVALWSAGFCVRLEPRADGEGFFLLPVGQSWLTPGELERLFERYERDHDAALLVLLLSLPTTPDGGRDVDQWNRSAEALHPSGCGCK